jgi:small subunit ribosomal protein S16
MGRRHKPYFRLCAMDARSQRDGRTIEELGTFNPLEKDDAQAVALNTDRVKYWLGVGAQPSPTVRSLLRKQGLVEGPRRKIKAKKA